MPFDVSLILSAIVTVIAMIFIYAVIMKEGNYSNLSPLCKKLHDIFNFKKLLLESVLKFCYILCTVACVVTGAFMLISVYGYYEDPMFFMGLITIVLGPIAIRLTYEASMMFIILVNNVVKISKNLEVLKEKAVEAPEKETQVEK